MYWPPGCEEAQLVVPIGAAGRAEVCSATGLNIIASASQRIYRVAKTTYGALNPPSRPQGANPANWSRWDTPGRTIYGGSTDVGAFIEVLEYITPDPPATDLSVLFDDVAEHDAATLADQIACEMPQHGAMHYRSIPKGWRSERTLYELLLPEHGWFVDVTGADSISAIDREIRVLLAQHGIERLTLSQLTATSDEMKSVTTGIATWVRREVVLYDGSLPHGIVYPSKWGRNHENWAMWLRRTDDQLGLDPVTIAEASDIGQHTRADFRKQSGCAICEFTDLARAVSSRNHGC